MVVIDERKKMVKCIFESMPKHLEAVTTESDLNWIAYQLQQDGFHEKNAYAEMVYDDILSALSCCLTSVENGRVADNENLRGRLEAYREIYNKIIEMKRSLPKWTK